MLIAVPGVESGSVTNRRYDVDKVLGTGEVTLTNVPQGLVHKFYKYMVNTYCVPGSVKVVGGLEMNQPDLQMLESALTRNLRSQAPVVGTR